MIRHRSYIPQELHALLCSLHSSCRFPLHQVPSRPSPPPHLAVECVVVVFSAEQEQRIVQDVKLLLLGLHPEGGRGEDGGVSRKEQRIVQDVKLLLLGLHSEGGGGRGEGPCE